MIRVITKKMILTEHISRISIFLSLVSTLLSCADAFQTTSSFGVISSFATKRFGGLPVESTRIRESPRIRSRRIRDSKRERTLLFYRPNPVDVSTSFVPAPASSSPVVFSVNNTATEHLFDATESAAIPTPGSPIKSKDVEAVDRYSPAFLAIDPKTVEIVPHHTATKMTTDDGVSYLAPSEHKPTIYPFVNMIRGSANYIAQHRGELAVFHIPGELLEWDGFSDLMDDIALTWLLGMKIVIVVGCRYQMECKLENYKHGHECHNSLRVTDDETLRVVEEEAGYVRFEVERQLNRCLRIHGGVGSSGPDAPPPAPDGNVVGGNFYTSKAFGVIDDIDYKHTGYPCYVEAEKIHRTLESNDVVLLTTVGVDRLGNILNVNSESLAAFVASSLKADKIIYCSDQNVSLRHRETKRVVKNFSLSFAKDLLMHHNIRVHRRGFATFDPQEDASDPDSMSMLLKIGWAATALESGVTRAHIIGPNDGALLEELYTAKDGSSACLSHDEHISNHPDDVFDDDVVSGMMRDDDDDFDDGRFDGTFFENFMKPVEDADDVLQAWK